MSLLTFLALGLGAAGAIWDIRHRKIPNWLCALFAFACMGGLVLEQGWQPLGSAGLHALIALVVGMLLFRLGWIGGGDAKFYTGAALGTPLAAATALLFWTSVAGLVLLIVMSVLRFTTARHDTEKAKRLALIPYGVAIAAGYAMSVLAPFA